MINHNNSLPTFDLWLFDHENGENVYFLMFTGSSKSEFLARKCPKSAKGTKGCPEGQLHPITTRRATSDMASNDDNLGIVYI